MSPQAIEKFKHCNPTLHKVNGSKPYRKGEPVEESDDFGHSGVQVAFAPLAPRRGIRFKSQVGFDSIQPTNFESAHPWQ
jgi:hypothetical protein